MLDLLIATVLITSPDIQCASPPCRLETLQAVAVSLELMDPREAGQGEGGYGYGWLFREPASFGYDLNLIHQRYTDLADAPPACDAEMLPARWILSDACAFNRQYRQRLQDSLPLAVDPFAVHEAIAETERLYAILDMARDARSDYYFLTVRRKALRDLREEIGAEAYYRGCLPPAVPVWRFNVIGD